MLAPTLSKTVSAKAPTAPILTMALFHVDKVDGKKHVLMMAKYLVEKNGKGSNNMSKRFLKMNFSV